MADPDKALKSIEINKEIILMRKQVRKARVYLVSKLKRESDKLRKKNGNEKLVEKCKKKAERLGREIRALKSVTDDDISRYGIINAENLVKTSQNSNVPDATRVTAKVASNKVVIARLTEFRKKFPDYAKYISLTRPRKSKKKKKVKPVEKKPSNESSEPEKATRVPSVDSVDEESDHSEQCNNSDSDVEKDSALPTSEKETNELPSTEVKKSKPKKKAASKKESINTKPSVHEENIANTEPKAVKVISKVATVKRFTEVLQEEPAEAVQVNSEVAQSQEECIEVEKEVDDFFMSADSRAHLVTKAPVMIDNANNSEEAFSKDRYFSKPYEKRQKDRSFNNNKWENGLKRKGNWNDTDKAPFSKSQRGAQQDFRNRNEQPYNKKLLKHQDSKAVAETENLHPSWEARKKQQEIMKQGFQGKKIVFGDD